MLSDPFQRQRYDAQLDAPADGDVELVDDDDAGPRAGTGQQLTGWRKLLAPPPPKENAGGAKNGNGKKAAPADEPAQPARADDRRCPKAWSSPNRGNGAWRCCSTSPSSW